MGKNYYKNNKEEKIEDVQLMTDEQVTTDREDSITAPANNDKYPRDAVIDGCVAVNLRKDSNPTSEIVKTLREGALVTVIDECYGKDYSIVEDRYNKSIIGYIPSKFLK